MKKRLAIFLVLVMVVSLVQAQVFAVSDSKVIVLYNNDDAMIGSGWSTNGAGTLDIVAHPVAGNGNAVQMSSVKKTLYHSKAITAAYYGSMEIYFDMYQPTTTYETNFQLRRFAMTGGGQVFDKKFVQLSNGGNIKFDAVNTGWCYKGGQNYKFKVVLNSVKQTYSVYLVKGMVSTSTAGEATLKENLLLAQGNLDATFAAVSAIQFNSTQTDTTLFSYIDNIQLIALPAEVSAQEVSDGVVATDVSQFHIDMNQYINTAYASGFSVTKNGIALATSDYAITYGTTVPGTTFSKNMVLTLNQATQAGDHFTFSFGSMRDAFDRTLEDRSISFSAGDLTSIDATIKGITGYEDLTVNHADNTISSIVGGYPSQPIFDNIMLAHANATKQLLDVYGNDVTGTKTALYQGDKVKITAADGVTTKTYTIVEKTAVFEYNFNNASTNEASRVHSGNRSQTTYSALYPAGTAWANIYIAGTGAGTDAYATAGYTGVKTDVSAKLVLNSFVNDTSTAKTSAIWRNIPITQGNNYVISVDLKPMDTNANVYLSLRAGMYNTGSFIPAPFYMYAGGKLLVSDSPAGKVVPNTWYNVSAVIDTTQKLVKVYVNGQYFSTNAIPQDTLDAWTDTGYIAVQLGQSAPAYATTTSTAYYDNLSVREIYSIDSQPNGTNYVLASAAYEINHNEGKIYCQDGTTAEDILSSLSGYPNSYSIDIYNNDETSVLSGALNLADSPKLVIQNGDKVVSYHIVTPEMQQLMVNGKRAYQLAVGTNIYTINRTSGTMVAALFDTTNGNMLKEVKMIDLAQANQITYEITDTAANTMLKLIILDTLNSLKPTENSITILGK